jgi:hypothetical protein
MIFNELKIPKTIQNWHSKYVNSKVRLSKDIPVTGHGGP